MPSDEAVVSAMLRFAEVGPEDRVYDLGCGDGRIVVAAAREFGASGVGVDIDPQRIDESRRRAREAGVEDRTLFFCKSFFDVELRPATVVTLYLLPSVNLKLRPRLLTELRPGARVVANYFPMGDWRPDLRLDVHNRTLYQWIIPAWVAGRWHGAVDDSGGRHSITLDLQRAYQTVLGTARFDGQEVRLLDGVVRGVRLRFTLPDPLHRRPALVFEAHVHDGKLRGRCRPLHAAGPPVAWGAVRR